MASWTEKRVERLKLLHKEGFSGTVIAKKLGPAFTKGMVAGKIRRLGLTVKPAKKRPRPEAKLLVPAESAPLRRPSAPPKLSRSSPAPVPIVVPAAVVRTPKPIAPAVTGIRSAIRQL
jgi:hypothetical protein